MVDAEDGAGSGGDAFPVEVRRLPEGRLRGGTGEAAAQQQGVPEAEAALESSPLSMQMLARLQALPYLAALLSCLPHCAACQLGS